MLPIPHYVLPLKTVAEYWSREIAGVRTTAEIYGELLSAFWLNELTVFGSRGEPRIDRQRALGSVRLKSEHPGFTVVGSEKMVPPEKEEHPDGSSTIDLRSYIVLPSDEAYWSDDMVEAAYRTLATMSLEDFHDLLKPILRALSTTQDALGRFL